jgi:peptidoglycan/xylan/chitin deacetylase (PgdA/CDA1 family)
MGKGGTMKMNGTKKKVCVRILGVLLAALLCLTGCGGNGTGTGESDTAAVSVESPTETETEADQPADTRPMIALTFDDGPHNVRTQQIVDELNKYDYHATFFVVGNRVDGTEYNGGAGLQYAVEAGNEIGIHGYTHDTDKYYDICTDAEYEAELSNTKAAIQAKVPNYEIKLMRPVGGRITDERAASCPYSVIMWDIDSEDWRYKYKSGDSDEVAAEKVNTIVENVMSQVHEGGIILMHDIYESTYDATVIILKRLNEMGYRVVTVSELLGASMQPGQTYSHAVTE